MTERRSAARWQINLSARVIFEGAENPADCIVKDISFKGLRILLSFKLPKDAFVKLTLVLSDNLCLDIETWVVWQKGTEGVNAIGLYFTKIRDEDKQKVYQFIQQNYPKEITRHWWEGTEGKGGETMQGKSFEDRRIFGRFGAALPVRFIDLKENRQDEAYVRDISAKGVGFLSKTELKPQTPLELWLEIPDKGEPLYARAEVVWSKMVEPDKFRVGVNLERANLMGLSRVLRVAKA